MPRPIWSGAVSFGLVNVPVKLTTAQSPKDVRFNQLDGKDGTKISTKRVRPDTGEEVPYERLVKGYEISPNRYVMIEPSELEGLDPKAGRTIDIEEFVALSEIDPLYFEKGYYLLPDKGAEKAYALLAKAMEKTGRVAIARFVMRTKQYLAAIRAKDGALVLSTMLYADEVTTTSQLDLPDAAVTFLRYHGENDDDHLQMFDEALQLAIATRADAETIVRHARVTARLYRLQLEELDNV